MILVLKNHNCRLIEKALDMFKQRRILIIDDDVGIGEVILEIIRPYYPNSIFISDPEKAKECLLKENFSLIISDVFMPGLSGTELIKQLRANGNWTLVMFLTGNATKDTALAALRLGAVELLEKPFDEKELLQTIERVHEIEKRKVQLIEENLRGSVFGGDVEKKKKMLGLLHIANQKRKPAS